MEFLDFEGLTHYHNKMDQKYIGKETFEQLQTTVSTVESELSDVQAICADTMDYLTNILEIYVNGETGDDSNSGASRNQALATLDKAIELAKKSKKAQIYMHGRCEYTITQDMQLVDMNLSFFCYDSAVIKTRQPISIDSGYLQFIGANLLTIESAVSDSYSMRALNGGFLYIVGCTINTNTVYCMYAANMSRIYSSDNTFNGASNTYSIMMNNGSTLIVNDSTDNTNLGMGIYSSSIAYIFTSGSDIPKYTTDGNTIVYIDGQQVIPELSVQTELQEIKETLDSVDLPGISETVKFSLAAQNIYVNAETGDDSNSGIVSTKPFATLGKAIELAKKCKKSIIYISAGEYTISGANTIPKVEQLSNMYCRFQGNTAEDTIIKTSAEIIADNSYLYFSNLTVDSSGNAVNTIKGQHASNVAISNCIINTTHNYCAYAIAYSNLHIKNTIFNGTPKLYASYVYDGGKLCIDECTDNTGKGIRVGATSVAYIKNTSENALKYAISDYGMVYLNGQQIAPTPTSETAILSMGGNVS